MLKNEKQEIIAAYATHEGDTGLARGADRDSDESHQRAQRAFQEQSKGSSQPPRHAENGRSQKESARLSSKERYRALPCDRGKAWPAQIIADEQTEALPLRFVLCNSERPKNSVSRAAEDVCLRLCLRKA